MHYFIIYLLAFGFFSSGFPFEMAPSAAANGLGTPRILNYTPEAYNGGTQTWSITEMGGYVFFGNNDGVLVFDGSSFTVHPLPNQTIVRSVSAIDGKIYVGGQNEFGYFKFLANGTLEYQSLSDQLPQETKQRLSDVWAIHETGDQVVFQSDHHLMSYVGDEVEKVVRIDPIIIKSSSYNGRLFWFTAEQELYEWQSSIPVLIGQFPGALQLTPACIYPLSKDSIIIPTLYDGFYLFHEQRIQPYLTNLGAWSAKNIYSVQIMGDNWYIGTTRDGVYHINKRGQLLNHYSVDDGLQNNTILSMHIDSFGNIWAGLDRGLDFIPSSSPFKVLYPDGNLRGTGYGAIAYKGQFYFATNNGLYGTAPTGDFQMIKGSAGQVWRIQEIDGQLYVCHHRGLFQLVGDSLALLSPTTGSWLLRTIPETSWVIEGTYEGMNIYEATPEGLIYKKRIYGFEESSRYISVEGNRIWVAHPYKGLFGLTMGADLKIESQQIYKGTSGLETDLNILTFQLDNEVIFTGKRGIYQYVQSTDSFVVHPDFAPFFDSTNTIKLLREGMRGDLWFVEGDRVGYLAIKETSLRKSIAKHVLPALPKALTGGFEFVLPEKDNIILAVEEGFILINRERIAVLQNHRPSLRLNQFIASGRTDTVLQLGFGLQDGPLRIPADFPSVSVDYAVDNQAIAGIVHFQYRLLGFSEEWSSWTTQTSLRYNYLQPGDYILEVRCRMMDTITAPTQLAFTITLPWYKRPAVIITFLVLFGLVLLGLALVPSIRFHSAKRKLEYSKVKEIRAKEQQFQTKFAETQEKIDKLESEKMQATLNHQAKELASTTMHLVQKGDMLSKIKDNLTEVNKIVIDPKARKEIKGLIRTIEADVNFDTTWQNFENKFDKVHVNFTVRLKELYPTLTPNDIKLCTYLKLNLTSKEIASLTNISVRGVEISRYRLRKKLELESHDNLVEFIQSI